MGVTAGDYDGDGRQDVFVTNFSEDTPTLYRNLGNWLFADATFSARLGRYRQYLGWGTLFFDYDNDSWEDLFLANGHVYREIDGHGLGSWRQRKLLYRNLAQGAFGEARAPGAEILRPTASRGAAAEDFNGDGYLDLVVVNLGEPPSLLLNRSRGANWLMVRLAGSKSNRSAIGAVVVVETQGRRQIREVRSSSSYYSASGLRLHFGLGTAGAVDVLEVRWPAGGTSRFRALAANRVVTVAEDQGLL
ncbi:MAG: CRTAC1 family protein, partial [Acidobacteria bacterium]|nr:CRTAC1 family protein [Acidobacteriota bacterium]